MKPMEFVREKFARFFQVLCGISDMELDYTLKSPRYVDHRSEFEYACGTDKNTFYALNAFATCPRSYLLRYLLDMPLSIPFYEQVQEVVREVVADEATGRIQRNQMRQCFEKLYDELVIGPFPIHQRGKTNWKGSWKESVGAYMTNYSPEWERRGWKVKDAYVPVSATISGQRINGTVDVLLENEKGELALVIHAPGSVVYRDKKTGEVCKLIEAQHYLRVLKREAYVYGEALIQSQPSHRGKIQEIILNFYKPNKGHNPFELVFAWNDTEKDETLCWVGRVGDLIKRSEQERDWPAAELEQGNESDPKTDRDYCQERCPNCLRCHWAGMHPEVLKPFADITKVMTLPQKYIGVEIPLRKDLDRSMKIRDYKGKVKKSNGKMAGVSSINAVIKNMGVETIGELEGKRISDLIEVPSCGVGKLSVLLDLFYECRGGINP